MTSFEEYKLWKKDALQQFLRDRGIPCTGSKDQLTALVYGAQYFQIQKTPNAAEINKTKADEYRSLLHVGATTLPDPYTDLCNWVGETKGMCLWPPTMYGDIAEYLVDSDKALRKRLLSDYKEGKAFSYFDSKWLHEVFYHPINDKSKYCFVKAECTPSMNIKNGPHKVWVCIVKTSGKIESAYCSCFAGLGSTCNHVAAVLFKLDYAWSQGYTNKACTSRPVTWTAPSYNPNKNANSNTKKIKDCIFRHPKYNSKPNQHGINPPVRKLFKTSTNVPNLTTLMGRMYTSCPDACSFEYAEHNTQPKYDVHDDVNVEAVETVETSATIKPTILDLVRELGENFSTACLPHFDDNDVLQIQTETALQANSSEWWRQRAGRITASMAHTILAKSRKLQNGVPVDISSVMKTMVMESPQEHTNHIPALKYGRQSEPKARETYMNAQIKSGHKKFRVSESGLHVHKTYTYMAASPDGIVECDCCGTGIVEIKCPISIAHSTPQSSSLAYLMRDGDALSLKKTHNYMTQILMQLLVTGHDWCDFFVYTPRGYHLERLHAKQYASEIDELERANVSIFEEYIVPEFILWATKTETVGNEDVPIEIDDNEDTIGEVELAATNDVHDTAAATTSQQKRTMKPRKAKRTKKGRATAAPIYACGVCHATCKYATEIEDNDDNSIGCDKCRMWYHWSCVGYSGIEQDEWFCHECTS